MMRRCFTCAIAFVVLIVCTALLVYAQIAAQSASGSTGSKEVWLIANTSSSTSSCFENCKVSMYSDQLCTQPLNQGVVATVDSDGDYVSKSPLTTGFSTLTPDQYCLAGVWRPKQCTPPQFQSRRLLERQAYHRALSNSPLPTTTYCGPSETLCSGSSRYLYCYSQAQTCDTISYCPSGDDELGCSYPCSSSQVRCPSSGLCVDSLAGTCPECSTATFNTTSVCVQLNGRFPQGLPQCNSNAVQALFTNTFTNACPGGFLGSPCCSLAHIRALPSANQTLSCTGSIYSSHATGGESLFSWMQRFCYNWNVTASLPGCSAATVEALTQTSGNCALTVSRGMRWCQCLDDLPLMQPSARLALDQCDVSTASSSVIGRYLSFPSRVTLLQRLREGCSDDRTTESLRDYNLTDPSPRVVFTTTVTGLGGSVDQGGLVNAVWSLIGLNESNVNVNVTASISTVTTGLGRISISMRDRANDSLPGDRNISVGTIAAQVNSSLFALQGNQLNDFGLAYTSVGDIRVQLSKEEHCPSPDMFQCPVSLNCIPQRAVCDGVPDCSVPMVGMNVTADEFNCSNASLVVTGQLCLSDEYQCSTGNQCILDLYWCDGRQDCYDNSDETDDQCVIRKTALSQNPQPVVTSWVGYHFQDAQTVQCIEIVQPQDGLTSAVGVFACDSSVVFRPGSGSVLRNPADTCTSVASSAIGPLATGAPVLSTGFDSRLEPPLECTGGQIPCSSLTGKPNFYCVNFRGMPAGQNEDGLCQTNRTGVLARVQISQDTTCQLSQPINYIVVKALNKKYNDEAKLVKDSTYQCFCEQQIQYNFNSNPLYIFPPYDTPQQEICKSYFSYQIINKTVLVASVLGVAILNFILKTIMYLLVKFEAHYSLTDKAMSETWKLFVAQFINTAIIVLLVNAQMHGISSWSSSGIGKGQFDDFTKGWYVSVGAGLCITIIVQIASAAFPPVIVGLISRCTMRRRAKTRLTQDAMNKDYEFDDFALSLRLAQSMNVIMCAVMYSAGMPLMLWIGAAYCVISYWCDKYFLLRCSRIPPQYSEQTVKLSLKLFPVGVVGHCLLAAWMYGNQLVFPSDFVNFQAAGQFSSLFDYNRYFSYLTGGVPSGSGTDYTWYLESRLYDCLRQAPLGPLIVLGFTLLFLLSSLIYNVFGTRLIAFFRFILSPCSSAAHNMAMKLGLVVKHASFKTCKAQMDRNRVLSSYHIHANPRYVDAYKAISTMKEAAVSAARMASISAAGAISSSASAMKVHPDVQVTVNDLSSPTAVADNQQPVVSANEGDVDEMPIAEEIPTAPEIFKSAE